MIKILVVDDEQGICDFIEDFFGRRGHIVLSTTKPDEALSILEKEKPQIVILDKLMTDLDGMELLKRIRRIDDKVKVIMVTVADEEDVRKEAFRQGVDAFIGKPFTSDVLGAAVLNILQELTA